MTTNVSFNPPPKDRGSRHCAQGDPLSSILVSALDPLRLIPVLVHLLQRNFRPGPSLLGDPFFDVSETAAELTVRGLERAFRLHAAPAGQVSDDEENIADLAGDGFVRDPFAGHLFAQLADLFFEF